MILPTYFLAVDDLEHFLTDIDGFAMVLVTAVIIKIYAKVSLIQNANHNAV